MTSQNALDRRKAFKMKWKKERSFFLWLFKLSRIIKDIARELKKKKIFFFLNLHENYGKRNKIFWRKKLGQEQWIGGLRVEFIFLFVAQTFLFFEFKFMVTALGDIVIHALKYFKGNDLSWSFSFLSLKVFCGIFFFVDFSKSLSFYFKNGLYNFVE